MKHVLLASLGGTSQVITETLWALMNPDKLIDSAHRGRPPVVPKIVHLISTNFANKRHYSSVEDRNEELKGKISELYRQFGHSEPEIKLDPLLAPDSGEILTDIRTQRDNVIYADQVTRVVKHYADDPETSIHMSLAGGRKTMSSYDHSAMMFFGRVQDEMSHVLIEPAAFERIPNFWWPDQKEPLLVAADDDENSTSSPNAQIDLINVPFVRLYVRLPKGVKQEALNHDRIVEFVEFERNKDPIIVDADKFRIGVGKDNIFLTPQQFAFFALFAIARHQCWGGVGPPEEGEGHNAAGWLRVSDFNHGMKNKHDKRETRALFVLRTLMGRKSDGARHRSDSLMKQIDETIFRGPDMTESDRSKLRRALTNEIANPFIQSVVIPQSYKGSEGNNIGLEIPAHRIRLEGFTKLELDTVRFVGK